MNWFRCLIPSALSVLLSGACTSGGGSPPAFVPAVEAQMDTVVREHMVAQRLPGVVVLVSVSKNEYSGSG